MTTSRTSGSHDASSNAIPYATDIQPLTAEQTFASRRTPAVKLSFRLWSSPWTWLVYLFLALALDSAHAQQFRPMPALYFSKTFGGANPLSQVITPTSTGTAFAFGATASTNSGGAWLSLNPSSFGCCGVNTPYPITVIVNPTVTLAAGIYTGQIVLKPGSSSIATLTVPVTLVVHDTTDTYFDQIAGGLTFSMATAGGTPPGQQIQIRNAGAGTLAWTATTSTSDGNKWLSLSASSGTAGTTITVSIDPAALPGLSSTAGTFTGQVVFKTTDDTVTVPITVNVGASVFRQVNPLNFTKLFGGANPLSQTITIASTETAFAFFASVQNSTGGNWLTITPNSYGCCGVNTPYAVTIGVNPAVTLAAGTYVAEVIVTASGGQQLLSIPVTLMIKPVATGVQVFDNVSGALNFTMAIDGDHPPAQDLQIRNAGSGTLTWTATASTADGGDWITLSASSGTATDNLSVSVNPANISGSALVAGTFVGQIVLQGPGNRITIPVSLAVGANVFRQVNPLYFTKVFGGPNPLAQTVTISSTGTNFAFNALTINSTGGSWLTINPSSYGCCGVNTPHPINVSVNPSVNLAAGVYTSEIVVESEAGDQVMSIPVTLTIQPDTATFFDDLPGQMSFFMATGGNAPPPQVLPIRNAGAGTLDWTATATTADGGNWLSISATSGTAPSFPTASVNSANLPGGGLIAGTFAANIQLEENGNYISIPVTMIVGANVFVQVNPLQFTMTEGGANPLPQVMTIASTGKNFAFFASAVNSTGGNWLSITPASQGCCGINTPYAITVTATVAPTLAAGTYSSEVIITSSDGTQGMTVPVTLTVEPRTATYFDTLPGGATFSMVTGGNAPPAQPLEIRNAGAGSLAWTATVTTADGGAWLSLSATSGTAPSIPTLTVTPAKLPGEGLVAGTFDGQVILISGDDRVTIPVTMSVGANVFRQVNGLDFNKVYGGANPLPQLLNISSTGANFAFFGLVASSTGGTWLAINPSSYGCCGINTPHDLIVTLTPAVTLTAGTYTSEIILQSGAGSPAQVIPVTLTVSSAGSTYFDDMPGAVTFFQTTGGAAPATQTLPIRNAGGGPLDWKATASTSDGGAWLTLSASAGTTPSRPSISIVPANLPGKGLTAGSYNGTIVLTSSTDRQTVPVSVFVGANVFRQLAPLSFGKAYEGGNPAAQVLNVASTATNFAFFGQASNATGGSWLVINPSSYGCCGINTPEPVSVSVAPVTTLAEGSYYGEVIFVSAAGDQGMLVPINLQVNSTAAAAAPEFNPAGGTYSTPQSVSLTDGTRGSTIYYTLNGTTPTTSSTLYTGPFTIATNTTLKAIAIAPGYVTSAVATAAYTITEPQAAEPIGSMSITISEATSGATVYYTTNGTIPTTSSTKYTGPITFTTSATLKFIAVAPGHSNSNVRTIVVTVQ